MRELDKVIHRLAVASYRVSFPDEEDPADVDLHAHQDIAKARAVYHELNKIDGERYEANVISND